MNKTIKIGRVSMPVVDYTVGATAVLGIRDSGKTVTSKGIAEQLLDNSVPIIVFDAVGKWRWMKVPANHPWGKAYKVVVAGGRQPDLPLTPHSIPEIVRSALRERIPLIIDLFDRSLSKADWRRIVQTAIRIIHYENEGGAVHVFLEEAAEFCPQRIEDGETYAEIEKLVRMGGNASVGITLINQRSQEVNKAVLDQCTTLVLGCQVGSKAIEAVSKWVDRLDPGTANEVTQSLPKLVAGEAWVWTRQNPDKPAREQIAMCRSFHPDRRTPEIVLTSAKPTDTAEFVARLSSSIPKIIEEQKANDPTELKRQVAALKKQLTQAKQTAPEIKEKEVSVLTDLDRARIKEATVAMTKNAKVAEELAGMRQLFGSINEKLSQPARHERPFATHQPIRFRAESNPTPIRFPIESTASNGELGKGAREILKCAAQHARGVTESQIAVLTGYKKTSRTTFKQQLMSKGYLVKSDNGSYVATQAGLEFLGSDFEPLPTGAALRNHWLQKLTGGELELFKLYLEYYPHEVTTETLMECTGYQKTSVTTFRQKLSARALISGQHASSNLFTD